MGQDVSAARRDQPPWGCHGRGSGGHGGDPRTWALFPRKGQERRSESDRSAWSPAWRVDTHGHQKAGEEPDHHGNAWKRVSKKCTIVLAVAFASVFSASVASVAVLLAVQRSKPPPADGCSPAGPLCPDGWLGYRRKCYFFSEDEGSWIDSQGTCSILNASLAAIDTLQELAFMQRYKGKPDHWIGLRKDRGQPWKWANGTEFNNMFEVQGGGSCAYLNDENEVGSLRCTSERHWICSKPDAFTAPP